MMDRLPLSSPVETSTLFRKLFHNAGITCMLVLDLNGNILDVNEGFLKTFEYPKYFLIGKNFSILFTEEDKLKQLPENEMEEAINTGSANDENYLLKGDGLLIWVNGESILIEERGKQYIIKIVQDIHTQKLLEEELVSKSKQQEKTIKDRNLFIHIASHDLKAPLANIEGIVNSLKKGLEAPEGLEPLIQMLDLSVKRLKSKLNELAATAKGQEEAAEVDFEKELKEVLLDLKEEITGSETEIISDFSKAPSINFSRKNLKSILQNLISNSVKFRSPYRKPKVMVDTEKAEDRFIVLRVQDNGLGIDDKDQNRIFGIYSRLNADIPGTGVGMAIVKRMVENAGGKLELQSTVGEGSTFTVFLPFHQNF